MPDIPFLSCWSDDDRPALWPHASPERVLPASIERLLLHATACCARDGRAALELVDEALSVARAQDDERVTSRVLCRAAEIAQRARSPVRCYTLCLEAQPLLERSDDRWRVTWTMLLRGQCCLDVGDPIRALAFASEAAERSRQVDDRTQLARSLGQMAQAHASNGDLDRAVDDAERALRMATQGADARLDVTLRHIEARLRLERSRDRAQRGGDACARVDVARAQAILPPVEHVGPAPVQPDGGAVLETMARAALAGGDGVTFVRAVRRLSRWSGATTDCRARGVAWLLLAQARAGRTGARATLSCERHALAHLHAHAMDPCLATALSMLANARERRGDLRGAYESCELGLKIEADQQREALALRTNLLALQVFADAGLREAERTLAYAQRSSNVGHLVASVNHELNQPLASIRMASETALALIERGRRDEAVESLKPIGRLGDRLVDLVSQMVAFPARPPALGGIVHLQQAVSESIALLHGRLAQSPCEMVFDVDDVAVRMQEARLVRVIANVVNNALDAQENAGARRIVFETARSEFWVTLRVRDYGPGLTPAVRHRLFEPFFTTKAAGRGLGLGLAMARDVLREVGGDLRGSNAPGGGSMFAIVLPRAG